MNKKKILWQLDDKAFWPSFRADIRNTGRAPNWDEDKYRKDIKWAQEPWAFKTGKAITVSPVVGADGTIYCGSADNYYYAINVDGSLKWKVKIGDVIDDAGIIGRRINLETGEEQDYSFFPGADGFLYKVNNATGEVEGTFEASDHYKKKVKDVDKVNWWEGDITFSKSGRILAGCDDFYFYQINPETMTRACPEFKTGNMIWSGSPTGFENEHYFGSLDGYFYSVDENGKLRWKKLMIATAGGGPTILDDGSVITGYPNNLVYCFHSKGNFLKRGRIKWKFQTRGDVWSSPALSHDGSVIYISSADGIVYALESASGKLIWSFPTLISNRCGPVLDQNGDVYIACGDAKIYKLSRKDGHRIWSFDCRKFNIDEVEEVDRFHFISSSIALTPRGIIAPNQNGNIYWIPFEYMVSEKAKNDERCCYNPNPDLPVNGEYLLRVTPGGMPLWKEGDMKGKIIIDKPFGRSDIIFLRFIRTHDGHLDDTRIINVNVTSDIPYKKHVEISTDANYINIVPMEILKDNQEYNLQVELTYIVPKKYGYPILPTYRHWRGKKEEKTIKTSIRFNTIREEEFLTKGDPLLKVGDVGSKSPGDIIIIKNICPWQEPLIMNLTIIGMDVLYILASPIYHDVKKQKQVLWCVLGEKIKGLDTDLNPEIAEYRVISDGEFIEKGTTPFRWPIDLEYRRDGTISMFSTGFVLNFAG
ncbi:MAG: outer membrane protein assembly factor BamB family protein, partial [Candidatus Helarchaeota archaeon]